MMYYSVCLVHRILNQKYPLSPTFEQTWMLIVADSEEDAKQKTSVAGMEKEETFYNQKGDEIHWYFDCMVVARPARINPPFQAL